MDVCVPKLTNELRDEFLSELLIALMCIYNLLDECPCCLICDVFFSEKLFYMGLQRDFDGTERPRALNAQVNQIV